MSKLSSYRYFSLRMLMVSAVPALMYWLDAGLWVAVKVFLGFAVVTQLAAVMIYRKDLSRALAQKRRSRRL